MDRIERFNVLLKEFSRKEINSTADIQKLPFTTKEDLQAFDISKCPQHPTIIASTSGSTKRATLIGHSEESESILLEKYRFLLDEVLKVPKGTVTCNLLEFFETFVRKLDLTTLISPNNNISEEDIRQISMRIKQSNTKFLLCSGHLLPSLFDNLKDYQIDTLVYTGVMVTEELQQRISKLVRSPLEIYASHEIPAIGYRIHPEEYYHVILPEEHYFEVLDQKAKSEGRGVLIMTDFNNHSYPIIRFNTGDVVTLRRQGKDVLIKLHGRVGSYVKIEGSLINKEEMLSLIQGVVTHNEFLLEITSPKMKDSFRVHLKESDYSQSEKVRSVLLEHFGCPVEVVLLQKPVPVTRTNKKINIVDRRTSD